VNSKALLITGSSRGIGAATAVLAAARGWDVAVNYLNNRAAAEDVVNRARSFGIVAKAIQGDIGSSNDVSHLFKEVDRVFGRLDGLVNNASLIPSKKSLLETSVDEVSQIIQTNLIGSISCLKEAASRMSTSRGGKGGSIVNVSSEAGKFGGDKITAYASSKAGINAATIGLARELAPEGIRINVVSPGIIDTESNSSKNSNEETSRLSSLPMGRMGTTKEVAAAILWLLSDDATYVSGAILPITGAR